MATNPTAASRRGILNTVINREEASLQRPIYKADLRSRVCLIQEHFKKIGDWSSLTLD